MGSAAKDNRLNAVKNVIPDSIRKIEKWLRDDLWMIGDGSRIMMCDFYYGHIYADLIANPKSWITKAEKENLMKMFPKYEKFG